MSKSDAPVEASEITYGAESSGIIDTLLIRKNILEVKLSNIQNRLNEVRAEISKLEIALDVIAQHVNGSEIEFTDTETAKLLAAPDGQQVTGTGWRTLSVPKMIEAVLLGGPHDSRQLTREIRRRFVPHIRADAVSSTAWRMSARGRLTKVGKLYSLSARGPSNDAGR